MKAIIGDYLIESDSRQLILKSKEYTEIKKEDGSIEKKHRTYGYYSNLQVLLRNISNQVVLDNDDVFQIAIKLDEIKKEIIKIADILRVELEEK